MTKTAAVSNETAIDSLSGEKPKIDGFCFAADRLELLKALAVAKFGVRNRTPLPILTHACLTASKGKLAILATDLDSYTEIEVPGFCEGKENEATCVRLSTLLVIARGFGAPALNYFKTPEGNFRVSGLTQKADCIPAPKEDFPVLPEIDQPQLSCTVKASDLRDVCRIMPVYASKEESRSLLMGFLFRILDNKAEIVATDTHRLFRMAIDVENHMALSDEAIIPAKVCIGLLAALNAYKPEMVKIDANSSQICFSWGGFKLFTRKLDGQFPNHQKVLPAHCRLVCRVRRTNFLKAINAGRLICGDSNNKKVIVKFKQEKIVLTFGNLVCDGVRFGENVSEVLTIAQEIGIEPEIEFGLNGAYLLDTMKAFTDEWLQINLERELSPLIFQGYDHETDTPRTDRQAVMMPMQK